MRWERDASSWWFKTLGTGTDRVHAGLPVAAPEMAAQHGSAQFFNCREEGTLDAGLRACTDMARMDHDCKAGRFELRLSRYRSVARPHRAKPRQTLTRSARAIVDAWNGAGRTWLSRRDNRAELCLALPWLLGRKPAHALTCRFRKFPRQGNALRTHLYPAWSHGK